MKTLHLAGNVVYIKGRAIQRCLICGYKLIDSKNCAMPVDEDGTVPEFPTWEVGSLVEVEGNRSSFVEQTEFPIFEIVIEGLCIDLVE